MTIKKPSIETLSKVMQAPSLAPVQVPNIKDLRATISQIASDGIKSVSSVRSAFIDQIPTLQSSGPGPSREAIIGTIAGPAKEIVKSTIDLGVRSSSAGNVRLPPRPEIDYITIDNDPTYGSLDGFYTKVVVSLRLTDVKLVKAVRLLRSTGRVLEVPAPTAAVLIDGGSRAQFRKNGDTTAAAYRAAEIGVGSKLTNMVVDGENVPYKLRKDVNGSLNIPQPPINTNRISSARSLITMAGADRSVIENVTFALNNINISPKPAAPLIPLRMGSKQGINVIRGSGVASNGPVVEKNNSMGFKEILSIPVSEKNMRIVGDFVEIDLYDPTVVFGREYTYYVVSHDGRGPDSMRSRLVTVPIMMRTPPVTTRVSYSVIAGRPRFSLSCDGKFVDHVEVFRKGGDRPKMSRLLGTDGSIVSEDTPTVLKSGFYHLIDIGIGASRSATFVDTNIRIGQVLTYRFYTVDCFGNKAQTPFECTITIPGSENRTALGAVSIVAEQAAKTEHVKVRVHSDDKRVTAFVISRREIGNGERSFQQPTEPSRFTLGTTDVKRSRSRIGPRLVNVDNGWNGTLSVNSGSAEITDVSVRVDRTYQYSVYGIDTRGNATSTAISKYIRPSAKPVLSAPSSFIGEVVSAGDSVQMKLSWLGPTDDFPVTDLIGNQETLAASSIRSVYQVERREVGTLSWDTFPATTSSFFVDEVREGTAPSFRPPFASLFREYEYRVIAMQSGGFISNYTEPVRLEARPQIDAIDSIWVRTTNTATRPIHIILSWNYDGSSIDGWEIERAAVNKIFSSKIGSINSSVVRDLKYDHVAKVKRESSRANSLSNVVVDDPTVFVGNRFFIDSDVSMDNSYFYRIKAVGCTKWRYAGINLTDTPHDRKMMSLLSDDEKIMFAFDPRPIGR